MARSGRSRPPRNAVSLTSLAGPDQSKEVAMTLFMLRVERRATIIRTEPLSRRVRLAAHWVRDGDGPPRCHRVAA